MSEFRQWVKYRKLRGSLNVGMRVEKSAALLATLYANFQTKNGGYQIYDFMQHDAEKPVSMEQAMESWA